MKDTSIHLLGVIIEGLENELLQFKKKCTNPTTKQENYVIKQTNLINSLSDVYDSISDFTLFDICLELQHKYDNKLKEDKDIDGIIVKIPLKFNAKHYAYIEFTL
jgi:hypothetical protein